MKKQKWEIHSIFKCESCGKEFEGRGNSKALSHAKKYKHKISGEIGYFLSYDYTKN